MTVDSEAIFALVEGAADVPAALEELYGSMATAWLDERAPRSSSSPAASAGRSGSAGATPRPCSRPPRAALELVERYTGVSLDKHELDEGTLVTLRGRRRRPDDARSSSTARSRRSPSPPFARRRKAAPASSALAALTGGAVAVPARAR